MKSASPGNDQRSQHFDGALGIAVVDGLAEPVNSTLFAETVVLPQFDNAVAQLRWAGRGGSWREFLACDLGKLAAELPGERTLRAGIAYIRQHRPRLHGCQLVLVPKQNEAS